MEGGGEIGRDMERGSEGEKKGGRERDGGMVYIAFHEYVYDFWKDIVNVICTCSSEQAFSSRTSTPEYTFILPYMLYVQSVW